MGKSTLGAFSPLSANPVMWLKGDVASSISLDGSDEIDQWSDLSGNGNHVYQSTTQPIPDITTCAALGTDLPHWDATNGMRLVSTMVWPTNFCLFIKFVPESFDTKSIIASYPGGSWANGTWRILLSTSTNRISMWQPDGTYFKYGAVIAGTTDIAYVITHQCDADANVSVNLDGVLHIDGVVAATPAGTNKVSLGAADIDGDTTAMSGWIAEVIMLDYTPSANVISRIEDYLA